MRWTIVSMDWDNVRHMGKPCKLTLFSEEKGTQSFRIAYGIYNTFCDYFGVDGKEEIVGKSFDSTYEKALHALYHVLIQSIFSDGDVYRGIPYDDNHFWKIYDVVLNEDGSCVVYIDNAFDLKGFKAIEVTAGGLKQLMKHFRVRRPINLVDKGFDSARNDPGDAFNEFMLVTHEPPLIMKSHFWELPPTPERSEGYSESADF